MFGRDSHKEARQTVKYTVMNTFDDILNFLRSCKDIKDFITLGLDKREVKQLFHKLMRMVS